MEPKTKMTIVYSPHYDGEVFLGDAPEAMGTIYCGTMGLMDFLQQRAGIHYNIKPDVEREADYLNAMNTFLADEKRSKIVFFKKAAEVDPLGVACELLKWRDALIMAGWNLTCTDAKCKKLMALVEIEENFHSSGIADCWRQLCEEYESRDVLQGMVGKVRFDCTRSDIPEIIKRTLYAIFSRKEVTFESNCCQQE